MADDQVQMLRMTRHQLQRDHRSESVRLRE